MPGVQDRIQAELMHSIAAVALTLGNARSASVALRDEVTDDLVFVAAAGEGADDVLGGRFPSGTGIAGQVLRSGQAVQLSDLSHEPRFARDIAAELGSEPDAMAAVPVLLGGRVIGVLEVLDPARADNERSLLTDLQRLAVHAAAALDVSAELC
ncbi:MAG TPA: GAF domain-containing protein [Solirubrobacteraceae bacterium]|jgi:signal transduction protein with GAF and PtsI domain